MSDTFVHVALFPSAGVGHLTPCLRFAALLVNRHCRVTLITAQPTITMTESKLLSRFVSAFPQVSVLQFHLLPFDASTANTTDPFFLQMERIRRSLHLLPPLLASVSPPLSAFVCDVATISPALLIAESLHLPIFTYYVSSAIMCSLFSYLPHFISSISDLDFVEIPGVSKIPKTSIPPLWLIPDHVFAKLVMEDSPKLSKLQGILISSFDSLEPKTLEALNKGKVVKDLPHVFTVGPLIPRDFEKIEQEQQEQGISPLEWLNNQAPKSVLYVSFGSRISLGREQIREIGKGLSKIGYKFVWVVKDKKVDREDEDGLEEVVGIELLKELKSKGFVTKEWVNQGEILGHKSVGGFFSHGGWNSIVEAAWHGVPILSWPMIGDQKLNTEVPKRGGWGMVKEEWGWGGEVLVKEDEIRDAIEEMMKNESMRIKVEEIKEEARKAIGVGGSSDIAIQKLIDVWKNNTNA